MPTKGSEGRCQTRSTCGPEEASNQRQLVGGSPLFHVESVGLLRGGGPLSPLCEVIRPTVLASRIVLTAVDPGEALASAAWFHLDQSLVDVLCEGDTINLSRTPRGGLGLSVIRGQDLIIALGAVTAVPLGGQLKVTVRRDELVRSLSLGGSTPGPWRHPVEITSLDRVPRKPRGYRTEGSAPENADECVLIVRTGACPDVAASASAQLLALSDALHLER